MARDVDIVREAKRPKAQPRAKWSRLKPKLKKGTEKTSRLYIGTREKKGKTLHEAGRRLYILTRTSTPKATLLQRQKLRERRAESGFHHACAALRAAVPYGP